MNKKFIFLGILSLFVSILIGCSKEKELKESIKLEIPNNIVLQQKEDVIKYLTVENGELRNCTLKVPGVIKAFNKENNLVIYTVMEEDNTNIIINNNGIESKVLVKGTVDNLIVNKNSTKILYKLISNDELIEYQSIDLKDYKITKLDDKIVISGNLVKFLNDDNIIFYGVNNEEKKSGIFEFNLENNQYKLIHQVSNAFIEYINILDDNRILLIEASLDGTKKTYIYNISNNKLELITSKIQQIEREVLKDNISYFIGNTIDSRLSLFSLNLNTKEIKRLIYDFPKNIIASSDVILNNNKIFFVGYEKDEKSSNIYNYDIETRSIKIISKINSIYRIIKESR